MSNFEFPSNIKQIGNISDNLRIYMEDYVFTYIQNYCQASENDEVLAMLVGRYLTIDSTPVLFISGCIQGKYCVEDGGIMSFTDKSYDYIFDQKDTYFPKTDVVGWVQSQPSYGTYLNPVYKKYHMMNFKKIYEVLFVVDPIQKLSCFYSYNEDRSNLDEIKGYFIYYDKNKQMHEYMMDNKPLDIKEPDKVFKLEEDYEDKTNRDEETPSIRTASRRRPSTDAQIRTRQAVRGRKVRHDQKRTVNMLSGLCAVMFLICLVMGMSLLQSEERITVLEQNLSALNTAYRNTITNNEATQSAFADQNEEKKEGAVLKENGNELLSSENPSGSDITIIKNANPVAETPQPSQSPASTATPSANSSSDVPESYTVQKGDNLLSISVKFYGNKNMVDKIMEANEMTNPDTIYFGKVLILPRP